ncbi:ABC-type metal ion transport system, periplasmic component/surface antigen [Lactobacillus delbrueckii subsp. delbrueckii DSM 20074 = JCM 1012]|uniref:MetQ/NlpA family ABC transporter substrate-binding protein n=1 Tax=Lactobacillus delbrueckii TaxID=1584 RepID=UPI00069BB2DE|nr:MetQ/NlpA family ABC transporter substrate-binding protein [Lactobacillus delbrueckii]APP10506.1 metal ABC transporter substrate-binding protein [Lactobacillus delbrueckii subsp. delbrueckii DSM 20074 = JCM 1012]KNZ38793.1 metal ABC transporter substrate-binding protein [Lactobacillus delbrueckii subsp. delbrueckii]KRK23296.1 ABC-type metal ion transport system, periplasmic component/surface antigen [Lactobacillus delbrueckii subsp. delbrueckii DSM 20074 = JCM 1012]MCT3493261.1 metal ABC tra
MRRKKKQQRLIAAAIALVVIIAAFFALRLTSSRQTAKSQRTTVTVGSIGPDVQVWQHIAKSSQAKKLGLKIKVKAFTDGPSLLRATSDGSINVSAFASWAYLEAYNKSKSNTGQQVALATTYLEPMGIYSSKYKKLSDLPKGATIALANNAANEARGLLLLQSAGLIKLKKNFDSASGNTNDIVSNTKKFKFKLIDDTTGPRIIKSVDAVLIGNTIALAGNLNVLKDSLYHEKIDQSTKNNINVLATAKKNKNNAAYKKLGKLYHNKQIQKWIAKKYSGTKVEVNKPVSYLTD